MKRTILLLVAAALVLTGCSSNGGSAEDSTSDSASISAPSLDAATFQSKIIKSGVIALDVRTADEYKQNHLIDARNIDVESSDFDSQIAALDKSVTYAIYCKSGRRSAIAYNKMKEAGFTSLFNLDGGIRSWQEAGLPIVGSY